MTYEICARESGDVIEEAKTQEEAEEIVRRYEFLDQQEGNFTPNFYEIRARNANQ